MRQHGSLVPVLALPLLLAAIEPPPGDDLPAVGAEGGPARPLSSEEGAAWLRGRSLFEREFQAWGGLGAPGFNATSCAACHKDPVVGGSGGLDSNVSLGERSGQDRYLFAPSEPGRSARPAMSKILAQRAELSREHDPGFRDRLVSGSIQTPSVLGLGLIETIDDAEILKREDPHDLDGDGVRGVASRLTVAGRPEIGRFGWRAQMPTLRDFVRAACGGELGLTVEDEGRGFGLVTDEDDAVDPEMLWGDLDDLVFYCVELAAPKGGNVEGDRRVIGHGKRLFTSIGCARCHVPNLRGSEGPVTLYSDLLLHVVVDPPRGEGAASRFRTPPLWGISETAPYLHDGRAETLEEALDAHEGEAARSREAYLALELEDREALLAFLRDL